jgi:transcriptional regulator GlxA family with amidase domain
LKIADLADIAGLAPRSFLRRFTRATGLKPTEYLQALRVDRARDLLLQTRDSTEQIGFAVGYTDSSAFQKIFKRLAGQSPAEFRRAFRQGDFAG